MPPYDSLWYCLMVNVAGWPIGAYNNRNMRIKTLWKEGSMRRRLGRGQYSREHARKWSFFAEGPSNSAISHLVTISSASTAVLASSQYLSYIQDAFASAKLNVPTIVGIGLVNVAVMNLQPYTDVSYALDEQWYSGYGGLHSSSVWCFASFPGVLSCSTVNFKLVCIQVGSSIYGATTYAISTSWYYCEGEVVYFK